MAPGNQGRPHRTELVHVLFLCHISRYCGNVEEIYYAGTEADIPSDKAHEWELRGVVRRLPPEHSRFARR